jgi:hypothetical protein
MPTLFRLGCATQWLAGSQTLTLRGSGDGIAEHQQALAVEGQFHRVSKSRLFAGLVGAMCLTLALTANIQLLAWQQQIV